MSVSSRRDFLKKAGLVGLSGSVAGLAPARAIASGIETPSDDWMGVLVDIPNCIGCRQCEAACCEANGFGRLPREELEDRSVLAEHRRPGPHYYTTINSFPSRHLFRLGTDFQDGLDRGAEIWPRYLELETLWKEVDNRVSRTTDPAERNRLRAEMETIEAEQEAIGELISDQLAQAFAEHGVSLPQDTAVTTTKPGHRWALVGGERSYLVTREADALSVSELGPIHVKANCLHCNEPACVSACLVGAFSKQPDGAVTYDAWKCMGCRYCMVACPFQIPAYEYDNPLTPQVRKCTLCANEGNPNKGGVPACVKICPQECLTYGKRSELLTRARAKIQSEPDVYADHIYGEHEVGGTSWLYLAPKGHSFGELGFVELGSSPPPMRTERIQHGIFKYFIPPLAWYGLLGAVMWVSRPGAEERARGSTEDEH